MQERLVKNMKHLRLLSLLHKSNVGAIIAGIKVGQPRDALQSSSCSFSLHGADKKGGRVKDSLLRIVSPKPPACSVQKVTVVGLGEVGLAVVSSLLHQQISKNLCLIDENTDKLTGEALDFLHGSVYLGDPTITWGNDYALTVDSHISIICAGIRPKGKQSRLDTLQANSAVIKSVVQNLVKYSPNTIIVMVTNPVDVLLWVATKYSGLPPHKVIGTGCSLDSARFRYFIADRLGIAPSSCSGYIIGEHGESCVPVWSGASVAGVRLRDINPNAGMDGDPENWTEIHGLVKGAARKVRTLKGCTSWAVAAVTAKLARSILRNDLDIQCLSVPVKGYHGVTDDVYLSLPAVVGAMGITDIVDQVLTPRETELFQKSAKVIAKVQGELKI